VNAVSVVMAVYNGRQFLSTQVASLLADLRPQDEVIVVDDASVDGTYEWLLSLAEPRIRLHRNTKNRGVRASFQRGLALATSDIVFLCDQDDDWLPGKRAAFVDAFGRDPDCLVVISDAQLIDGKSRVFADSFMRTRGGFHRGFWANLYRNRYLGCAMAVRRRLLLAALPIPPYVPMHDMWLGMLGCLLGGILYLPEPWLRYRRHSSNVSPSSRQSWRRILVWRLNLLRAVTIRLATLAFRRFRQIVQSAASKPRRLL
jgi:glycosyltransferase involved in cell wall biosynthesis